MLVTRKKIKNFASSTMLAQIPTSEYDYRILADELIQWAELDNSLIFDEFALLKKITPMHFHELPEKSEYFAQAYNYAMRMVGTRRERLAQEGFLNHHMVMATMPLYDPIYRKWILMQKSKEENKGATKLIVVEIPQTPTTDFVPKK